MGRVRAGLQAGQPPGSRGRRVPVAHKQGADRSGSGDSQPPRVFGFFLRVEKETAPPRAVAAKRKLDVINASAWQKKRSEEIVPQQSCVMRRTTHLRGSVPVNLSFAQPYFSLGGGNAIFSGEAGGG